MSKTVERIKQNCSQCKKEKERKKERKKKIEERKKYKKKTTKNQEITNFAYTGCPEIDVTFLKFCSFKSKPPIATPKNIIC